MCRTLALLGTAAALAATGPAMLPPALMEAFVATVEIGKSLAAARILF